MTNIEKIRQMSDEKMAEFLSYEFDFNYMDEICNGKCIFVGLKCEKCVLEWLHKEVEDDDEQP